VCHHLDFYGLFTGEIGYIFFYFFQKITFGEVAVAQLFLWDASLSFHHQCQSTEGNSSSDLTRTHTHTHTHTHTP